MDFISWLEALPADTVGKLYSSHWACQAVLRGLPPLAKQYVLRLLFLDAPVPAGGSTLHASRPCAAAGRGWSADQCAAIADVVASWPAQQALSKHRAALDRLAKLQLLPGGAARVTTYALHPMFRDSLRSAVTQGCVAGNTQWLSQPPAQVTQAACCSRTGAGEEEVPPEVAAVAPSREALSKYAQQQWEVRRLLAALVHLAAERSCGQAICACMRRR
jgi:transcription initiation factor TFIIH subunit 4